MAPLGSANLYVHIEQMNRAMRLYIEAACRQGRLTVPEGKSLVKYYDDGLEGYTYLEG
jgi:arginine decarboxylase-like protein